MSPSGFKINKQGIAKMTQEIQREFDKHPIRLPVEVDESGISSPGPAERTSYYGPVINVYGNRAQLAWANTSVTQSQSQTEQVSPGFEALAQAVVSMLQKLDDVGLEPDERATAEGTAKEVLAEVTKAEPDRGVIKRGVTTIKGLLTPIALGIATGAGEGAQGWARTAIEQLGAPF